MARAQESMESSRQSQRPMLLDHRRRIFRSTPCCIVLMLLLLQAKITNAQLIYLLLSPIADDEGGVRLTVQGRLEDLAGLSTTSSPELQPTDQFPPINDPCGERFDANGNYTRNFWFMDEAEGARVGDWCGGGALYTFDDATDRTSTDCPVVVRTTLSVLSHQQRLPVVGFGKEQEEPTVWLPHGYRAGTELAGSSILLPDTTSLADLLDASALLPTNEGPVCSLRWTSPMSGREQQIGVYVVGDDAVPHYPQLEEEEPRRPISGFLGFLGRVGMAALRALNVLARFFAKLREEREQHMHW